MSGEVLRWIDVWSSNDCVCCACDLSVYLDAPSIWSVCRMLSPHLIV